MNCTNLTPDFISDNVIGKIGEKLLIKILSQSPKTKEVFDASATNEQLNNGADVVQVTNDGKTIYYEVKTDRYAVKTRNLALEYMCYDRTGCFWKSNSDYWFYVLIDTKENNKIKESYLFKLKDMRSWIGKHSHLINKIDGLMFHYSTRPDTSNRNMDCQNLLVNIELLIQDGILKQIDVDGLS